MKVEPAAEGRLGWVRPGNGAGHSTGAGGNHLCLKHSRNLPPIVGVDMFMSQTLDAIICFAIWHKPQVEAFYLFIRRCGLREVERVVLGYPARRCPSILSRAGKTEGLKRAVLVQGARNSPGDLSVWRDI